MEFERKFLGLFSRKALGKFQKIFLTVLHSGERIKKITHKLQLNPKKNIFFCISCPRLNFHDINIEISKEFLEEFSREVYDEVLGGLLWKTSDEYWRILGGTPGKIARGNPEIILKEIPGKILGIIPWGIIGKNPGRVTGATAEETLGGISGEVLGEVLGRILVGAFVFLEKFLRKHVWKSQEDFY